MKTNLFLVGAPKTGSTSLYHYLAEHPQIFMCKDKEPHYFCSDFHDQCIKHHGNLIKFRYTSITQYNSLFSSAIDNSIIGEASTSYLYSTTAAKNIYKYNPNAKIIVILRNPIQLMHSWYHYINYTSEEPSKTFEQALQLEAKRKKETDSIPASVWFPARIFYKDLVQFDNQLKNYYDYFDHKNVKVILTEDLHEHPIDVYNEVLGFLDVSPYIPDFKTHNVYQEIRFKQLKWFIDNYLSKLKSFAKKHHETKAVKTLENLYKFSMGHDSKRLQIDTTLRHQLEDEFRPMVHRTGVMINQDLCKKWGFSRPMNS